MMVRRCRGSVTVFAALMLMIVAQFFFTLLEGARIQELGKIAQMHSDSQIESAFAQYCMPLVDNYGLLAYDLGDASGNMNINRNTDLFEELSAVNNSIEGKTLLSDNTNLLRLDLNSVDYPEYTLITDCNGKVYEKLVAAYMEESTPLGVLKKITNDYESAEKITKDNEYDDSKIDDAKKALKEAEEAKSSDSGNSESGKKSDSSKKDSSSNGDKKTDSKTNSGSKGNSSTSKAQDDKTFKAIEDSQAHGILATVLPKGTSVSNNSFASSSRVSQRSLQTGNNPKVPKGGAFDKVLYEQYLLQNMSCYTDNKAGHVFKYELEYLLCGKTKDQDNLKGTVERLLAMREAANMGYLLTSTTKKAEALALATTLAGVTANPVIIKSVQMGLLAAWAYCESTLDVRALLAGDKIPLVKTESTWTSGLKNISTLLSGNTKAKSSSTGLDYKNYLGTLLLLESVDKSAYRAMDLQEATIQNTKGYEHFKMDNAVCSMEVNMEYQYHYMFMSLVTMVNYNRDAQKIKKNAKYSYITDK